MRGQRAAAAHVDYSSAFDSLSHIYLFHSLEKAKVSIKTLQLYKAIYTCAQVIAKVGDSLSTLLAIGRGVLEGGINSPVFYSFGLETVFREADEISSSLGLTGGIKLRDQSYDKVVFTDDVTATGTNVGHLSHRIQILEVSSAKAGLYVSPPESCTQHIGYDRDAPAVTADDICGLMLKHECPRPWCTHRFASKTAVRMHVLWHDRREGGLVDQEDLALGQIVGARGPPEHRFFLVFWLRSAQVAAPQALHATHPTFD